MDELSSVPWAYHTTPRTATGETPFNMTFDTEAVILIEIGLSTLRTENFEEEANSEQLRANVGLLEETQEWAQQRLVAYEQKVARYNNSRMKTKIFRLGDLVLHHAEVSQSQGQGKLTPNWEGPYQVVKAFNRGAYRL